MLAIADADIGGARVARTFNINGKYVKRGDELTRSQVLAIPLANRRALIDSNYIEVYPRTSAADGEKFIVSMGKDKYNVLQGRTLSDNPLTRDQAEKLLRA